MTGLVDAGVIPNDTPRYLVGIMHRPNRPGREALELRLRQVLGTGA